MKPYLHQNNPVNTENETTNASNNRQNDISNSEMIDAMDTGNVPTQLMSNAERIQFLEQADLITDIGGVIPNPRINALNAGINGVKGFEESPCTTTTGKIVDGGLDAAFNFLLSQSPVTNVGDLVLPEGYRISEMTDSTSSAITSSVESLVTWDGTALENYTEKVEAGDYGTAAQSGTAAQQYWEEHGVSGGMQAFTEELLDLVK